MSYDEFLYGKDQTEGVVAVEVKDNKAYLYKDDGSSEVRENEFWMLYPHKMDGQCISLQGAAHYSWGKKFNNSKTFYDEVNRNKRSGADCFVVYNQAEQFMIKNGITCHLGMEPADLSVLSFDIETTGLKHDKDAKVLLIACTYRGRAGTERKLFSYDEYTTQKEMINAFCKYVRNIDPSVIVGHNIFNFDLPYLKHCGGELPLGRDGTKAKFAKRPSLVRKDQNSFYEYHNVTVCGRQIVDTFNLSIKYDTGRNYASYGLKAIIKAEGLERPGRQHYDASAIYKRYKDPTEWEKIKEYATDDGDDALKLFDLMIPAYFYFSKHVPRGLQHIINSNSGSQINSFLIRSYLQKAQGIPKADDTIKYEGGISYGEPGVYQSCFKVDVASLYPSIIMRHGVEAPDKDPEGHFQHMVKSFTESRLKNKRLAKETGERKYKDQSDAEKIFINSAYGFMNARGLNFNHPEGAALVCKYGRRILTRGINFATRRGFGIVNADTDSFMIHGFTDDKSKFLSDLNALYHKDILWEDDGYYPSVLVLKAKNYVLLLEDGSITQKGAAVKATTKEPVFREFISNVTELLLKGEKEDGIIQYYNRLASNIHRIDVSTITEWCSKKTVTGSVLAPKRTQEKRVKEAIERAGLTPKEGDKIHVFFEEETRVALAEDFRGLYSKKKYANKLYNTINVFSSVIDVSRFPKYHLKRHEKEFEQLRSEPSDNNSGLHSAS